MSGLLGREQLRQALALLASHRRRRRVVGHVYLIGGATMALAYDAERVTRDVAALIVDAHGAVLDAAADVARELGLPRSWLNEQATGYLPRAEDAGAPVVFSTPTFGSRPRRLASCSR